MGGQRLGKRLGETISPVHLTPKVDVPMLELCFEQKPAEPIKKSRFSEEQTIVVFRMVEGISVKAVEPRVGMEPPAIRHLKPY